MRRLGGVIWHTRINFYSLINVCDRFLERTKLSRSGARPGRELFIAHLGLGAHGGANGLVPLLPATLCEPDKAIRVALGEHHVEKCAMRKTLSGDFWTVSAEAGRLRNADRFDKVEGGGKCEDARRICAKLRNQSTRKIREAPP